MKQKATKAERVRALLRDGKTIAEVSSLTGVTRQYVYSLRYQDNKKNQKPVLPAKRGRGRPKGSGKKIVFVPQVSAPQTPPVLTLEGYLKNLPPDPQPKTFWQRLRYAFTGRI